MRGINPQEASQPQKAEIRKAYKVLALRLHPDKLKHAPEAEVCCVVRACHKRPPAAP